MKQNIMVKQILITGGLGLIGSKLAEFYVNSGEMVTIISRSKKNIRNIKGFENKINLKIKDIKDVSVEDVKNQDIIFHLASTVDNYNMLDMPHLDVNVNCNGTISLLEMCKKANPFVRIVYSSTFFVNGALEKLPATPKSPCEPLGIYPATKLAAEHFCKIYNRVFGMNITIARFTNVFGEKESKENKKKAAFNYLIGLALKNKKIPVYDGGDFYRDYIFVDDVASACQIIAEKGKVGEIYYVGNGKTHKFKELIKIVIEEAGTGFIIDVKPPKFHNQVGFKNYYCDNKPLKDLGWKAKVSLREGIKK